MRITRRKYYIELCPAPGKVFYNPENGDIAEGACIENDEYSDDIIAEYENMEMDKAAAEELAAAFVLEETDPEDPLHSENEDTIIIER